MNKVSYTRGYGLLEKYLAKKRGKMAEKLIPGHYRGGAILDIGCGAFPFFLVNTKFRTRYGLDKIDREERVIKPDGEANGVCLVNYDIEEAGRMPFIDDWFDVVTMLAVVEHILPGRLPFFFQEVYRVMRQGGLFIMTTPAAWAGGLLRVMGKLRLVSPVEIAEHKETYSQEKLLSFFKESGFLMEKVQMGYFECWMNIYVVIEK